MTSASSFSTWCQKLQQSDKGKATLSSISFDLSADRLAKSVCQAFHTAVVQLWNSRASAVPAPRINDFIKNLVSAAPATYLCKSLHQLPPVECSRTMEAHTFLSLNTDVRRWGGLHDEDTEDKISDLAKHGLRGLAIGEMRSSLPFAWVTKREELEAVRAECAPSELPNRVRDALGLYHYREDELLVEIQYPPNAITDLRSPTFLEGGTSLIYRSSSGPDSWGRALDLQTMKDGLPEAVHPPLPFTDAFVVRGIGRLTGVAHSITWSQVLNWTPCAGCGAASSCGLEGRLL